MISICRNILAALITAIFLSAFVFSFSTLNDLRIFEENLPARQKNLIYAIYL